MDSVTPVWTEEEVPAELVVALDQPEYLPIIVLCVRYSDGTLGASVRFRLTPEEREQIAKGADIVITELTFGRAFTPINVQVLMPGSRP